MDYLSKREGEFGAVDEMLKTMTTQNDKSFTNYLFVYSKNDVLLKNNVLSIGKRIYKGVQKYEIWKELGGTFSPKEIADMKDNETSNSIMDSKFYTTIKERKAFAKLSEPQRAGFIKKLRQDMEKLYEDMQKELNKGTQMLL